MKKYKDRKGINLLTIFLVIDLLAVFAIFKTTGAVYQSEAIGTTDLEVAFYAFNTSGLIDGTTEPEPQTASIELGEIAPGEEKKYKLRIYNTDENGKPADTNLSYFLKIITTTNLPLEYELYYNEDGYSQAASDLLTGDNAKVAIHKDEWGTYFRTIAIPEKCFSHTKALYDYYYLVVKMPENFDPIYQDLIESIKVQLESKQVMSSDIQERGLTCRTE